MGLGAAVSIGHGDSVVADGWAKDNTVLRAAVVRRGYAGPRTCFDFYGPVDYKSKNLSMVNRHERKMGEGEERGEEEEEAEQRRREV